MIFKNANKIVLALCVILVAAYLIGICLTYEVWEMLAYLSAFIGAGLVGLPLLISFRKTGEILKPVPILITILLFVALVGFDYWNWKSNFYYLLIALWPVICYGTINFIIKKVKSKSNIWLGMMIYNIAMVLVIYLTNEHMYKYLAADIIAEAYMYIIAQIALFLVIKKRGFKKNEITTYVICNIVFPLIWFLTQDRIEEIVISFSRDFNSVDQDGGYYNWFAQRENMLKSSINGDYSAIYRWHTYKVMRVCPIFHFYAEGYGWLSIIIIFVSIILSAFMIKLATIHKNNDLLKVFVSAFILQNIIGLVSNIFLIYSTSIGIMFIRNSFDIIPVIWILLAMKNFKVYK